MPGKFPLRETAYNTPVSDASNGHRIGVIVVDHGSVRDEANEVVEQFVQLLDAHSGYRIIEPAHMELAEPSIATALDRCVDRGAQRIVVAPYFLSPGKHWDQDIPRLTGQAAKNHPEVSCRITHPIGLHPLMVEIIGSRIAECLTDLEREGG